MIRMHQRIVGGGGKRGTAWRARSEVGGRVYEAASRYGASNELARQLVAAGVEDQAVEVTQDGLRGHLSWGSLHEMALWTYEEGDAALHRRRWRAPPERGLFGGGRGESVG